MISRTLYRLVLGPNHPPTGATQHISAGSLLPPPAELRIVQMTERAPQYFCYYLLYYDANGNEMTDTWHEGVEEAMRQAAFEFEVQSHEWQKVKEPLVGLAPVRFEGLARLPVTIAGDWHISRPRDWSGVATADEPIVAVHFITSDTKTAWRKSEKTHAPEGFGVRFHIGNYDEVCRHVRIDFGAAIASTVSSATYRPRVEGRQQVHTGETFGFTYIEGEPRAEFHLLFLARRDVRGGRKGLWQLRRALVEGFAEPWRSILTHSRTGNVNWSEISAPSRL